MRLSALPNSFRIVRLTILLLSFSLTPSHFHVLLKALLSQTSHYYQYSNFINVNKESILHYSTYAKFGGMTLINSINQRFNTAYLVSKNFRETWECAFRITLCPLLRLCFCKLLCLHSGVFQQNIGAVMYIILKVERLHFCCPTHKNVRMTWIKTSNWPQLWTCIT